MLASKNTGISGPGRSGILETRWHAIWPGRISISRSCCWSFACRWPSRPSGTFTPTAKTPGRLNLSWSWVFGVFCRRRLWLMDAPTWGTAADTWTPSASCPSRVWPACSFPEGTCEYRRLSRPLMGLLAMVWVGCLFWGIWQISGVNLGGGGKGNYMQSSKRTGLIEEQNVRAFIATDDPFYLVNKPPEHIPYTDAGRLMELLRNPKLLSIMPRVCRPPLKLEKDESSGALLVLNGYPPGAPKQEFTPVWGNCSNGAALTGHFASQSLNATLPKLSITLCCGPETNGVGIQLVEQTTGRRIELRPEITGRWHTIIVPAPRNPFRLEITNQNHNVWLAVGEISELGFLSDFALRLLNRAVGVLLAGLCWLVVLSGSNVVRGISRGNFFRDGGGIELLVLSAGLTALVWVWSGRNDGAGTGPPPAPTSSFLTIPQAFPSDGVCGLAS